MRGGSIYGVGGVYRESKAKRRQRAKRKTLIKCPGPSFFFFFITFETVPMLELSGSNV